MLELNIIYSFRGPLLILKGFCNSLFTASDSDDGRVKDEETSEVIITNKETGT